MLSFGKDISMDIMHSVFEQDLVLLVRDLRDLADTLDCKYKDAPKRPMYYDYAMPYIKEAIIWRWDTQRFIEYLLYARQNLSGWQGPVAKSYKLRIDRFLKLYA